MLLTRSITRSSVFLLLTSIAFSASAELQTVEIKQQSSTREFITDGMLETTKQTTVSAQTNGLVLEIYFDVDDFVEQGELLIQLKDTEQKARLNQAEADLKEAIARLQEAQDEFKRNQEMFGKKLISQSQMDKANATLKSARARQEAASAGLIQASEQFDYTRIRAPYSGIVTKRLIEVGEMAKTGQPLISGISLDQLRVQVDIPQRLIAPIREHNKARVILEDGESIDLLNLTVFPYAHEGSNSFTVRAELPAGMKNLFPGMFIKTAFVIGDTQQLTLPQQAVVYRSEVTAVYVVDESNKVHFRQIRLGRLQADGMIAVNAGLTDGERVALDPIAAGAELKRQLAEAGNE